MFPENWDLVFWDSQALAHVVLDAGAYRLPDSGIFAVQRVVDVKENGLEFHRRKLY